MLEARATPPTAGGASPSCTSGPLCRRNMRAYGYTRSLQQPSAQLAAWKGVAARRGSLKIHRPAPSWRHSVAAAVPTDVYVFGFEGVLCEPDTGQVYADAHQLQRFEAPFYIASGLPAQEVADRLKAAGLPLPPDSPQLLTGLGPTQVTEVLKQIGQRPVVKETGARLNLVSSSLEAMQAARDAPGLSKLRLYYAGWSEEGRAGRDRAAAEGVAVLDEKQLAELLSWGLLMGVDDGCGDDN